jgi:hypothetical protein
LALSFSQAMLKFRLHDLSFPYESLMQGITCVWG